MKIFNNNEFSCIYDFLKFYKEYEDLGELPIKAILNGETINLATSFDIIDEVLYISKYQDDSAILTSNSLFVFILNEIDEVCWDKKWLKKLGDYEVGKPVSRDELLHDKFKSNLGDVFIKVWLGDFDDFNSFDDSDSQNQSYDIKFIEVFDDKVLFHLS